MIRFRQKSFNDIVDGAWKGGVLGASIGTVLAGGGGLRLNNAPGVSKLMPAGKDSWAGKPWAVTVGGTIVGASLGALVGTIKEINKIINRSGADSRLMKGILKELRSYKNGVDYTTDPKTANSLRTKVCIAFTKNAAEAKILVNMEGDRRLKDLSDKLTRRFPSNVRVRYQQATNKFNEIEITTISDAPSNIRLISSLVSGYIDGGYPVYLVEVG